MGFLPSDGLGNASEGRTRQWLKGGPGNDKCQTELQPTTSISITGGLQGKLYSLMPEVEQASYQGSLRKHILLGLFTPSPFMTLMAISYSQPSQAFQYLCLDQSLRNPNSSLKEIIVLFVANMALGWGGGYSATVSTDVPTAVFLRGSNSGLQSSLLLTVS